MAQKKHKDPFIGVLVNKLKPLDTFKVAQALDVGLVICSPKSIDWRNQKVKGLLLIDGDFQKKVVPFPDVIIMRKYTSTRKLSIKIEGITGPGKVFNTITRFDKWKTYDMLRDSLVGQHLPMTYQYKEASFFDYLHRYKKVIIKPRMSYLGKGIYTIEVKPDGTFVLYHHRVVPELETQDADLLLRQLKTITSGEVGYILQPFIHFDRTGRHLYDIRLLVQKDGSGAWGVTGGFSRLSAPNFYKTNYPSDLWKLDELLESNNLLTRKRLKEMEKIGIATARTLDEGPYGHLGDISVDFGLGQDGSIWIIEVNGKTQKKMVTRLDDEALIKNAYLKPIAYAKYLAKQ